MRRKSHPLSLSLNLPFSLLGLSPKGFHTLCEVWGHKTVLLQRARIPGYPFWGQGIGPEGYMGAGWWEEQVCRRETLKNKE